MVASGGEVVEMQLAYDANRPLSPSVTLVADVSKLLLEVGLPQTLLEELPKRYVSRSHIPTCHSCNLSAKYERCINCALLTCVIK